MAGKRDYKSFKDIDGKKLQNLLTSWCAENDSSIYKLSVSFGYSPTWLYDAIKHDRIRKVGVKLLQESCGIEFKDYRILPVAEVKKEEPVQEETAENTSDFTDDEGRKFLNDFLGKFERIATSLEALEKIQMRNSETLEELKNMLK